MRAGTRAGAAVLTAAVLTAGCATAATAGGSASENTPRTDLSPYAGVVSRCDQFGHRLYWTSGHVEESIAVVPNDRSCPQPSPRARDL